MSVLSDGPALRIAPVSARSIRFHLLSKKAQAVTSPGHLRQQGGCYFCTISTVVTSIVFVLPPVKFVSNCAANFDANRESNLPVGGIHSA